MGNDLVRYCVKVSGEIPRWVWAGADVIKGVRRKFELGCLPSDFSRGEYTSLEVGGSSESEVNRCACSVGSPKPFLIREEKYVFNRFGE